MRLRGHSGRLWQKSLFYTCCSSVFIFSIVTGLGLGGCADALPGRRPIPEIEAAAARAEKAESRAIAASGQCTAELERSERLLKEAKEILSRAERAEARCVEIQRKAAEAKKRHVYRVRPKEKATPTPEEPKVSPTPTEPPYSTSDAP